MIKTTTDQHKKSVTKKDPQFKVQVWVIVLLFLIPVFIYLPGSFGFLPFPSETTEYSDLVLTHYPNALYLKNSIIQHHQIPLWSTLIHSGTPFAANPLSGLFYIPGWFALIFPLPEGISIVLALHAVFGTWGMYLFLKQKDINDIGAIIGALGFGLMPKAAAHYGAGHVTLLYAISWTPWLFFISRKDREGWKTGIVGAGLFLADPRWAVYAGLFWISFDIAHRHKTAFKQMIFYYLKSGITAFLLASPLILPMIELTRISTRAKMLVDDIQVFSFPPQKIMGLFFPTGSGNTEWYVYAGGVLVVIFAIQFSNQKLLRDNRFWNIWIIISFVIAFGSWIIHPEWLAAVPITSLLRVPARFLFLIGFCLSVIGGNSIQVLTDGTNISQKRIRIIAYGLVVFSLLLIISVIFYLKLDTIKNVWGLLFILTTALLFLFNPQIMRKTVGLWLFTGLLIVDLVGAGFISFAIKTDHEILSPGIEDLLIIETTDFRTYSPSYSLPQSIAAESFLEMADGVDPLQIETYSIYMERATGVEINGYSVTIPSFETGNPGIDNKDAKLNTYLLGLLNVKFVISEFELDNSNLLSVKTNSQQFVYKNLEWMPRAWIENENTDQSKVTQFNSLPVQSLDLAPNSINIKAKGPGVLILSEIDYPGWTVFVDRDKKSIEPARGILRSVKIEDGDHDIRFIYQPITVYSGIFLAFSGWFLTLWQIKKEK